MNTTELILLFFDNNDPKAIYIQDVSKYNPDLTPTCQRLEITPPGFTSSFPFEYPLSSFISVDSNAFGWTNVNCYEGLTDLQDGAWGIKQSVAPNDKLYKCYTHYKITNLKNAILEYLNSQVSCSDVTGLGDAKSLRILEWFQWLDCAKQFAEQFDEIEKANIIYNQVSKELDSAKRN